MGCDIHMYCEVQRSINNESKWVNCDNWRHNPYWIAGDKGERMLEIQPIYTGRNYTLFSVLADVRNYGENVCIHEPKGLPEDVCSITKAESDRWDSDGHTHSFFTLKELKDFQANNTVVKYSGLVTQEAAEKLDKGIETPRSWCQGASPELNYVRREWTEEFKVLDPVIKAMVERLKDEFWIFSEEYNQELDGKIRIVFWFDN